MKNNSNMKCVLVTALCNQDEACTSDLGDDQSRHLLRTHITKVLVMTDMDMIYRLVISHYIANVMLVMTCYADFCNIQGGLKKRTVFRSL